MPNLYPFERGPLPYDLKLWDYYYSLWTDRRWIHRRIDNIGASQSSTWSDIKITFDINAAILEATSKAYRISPHERLLLPLLTLPKSHLLGFEAEMNGKAQSLAGNDDSARIAQAISFCSFIKSHPIYKKDFEACYEKLAEDTYRAFKNSSANSLIKIALQHSQESEALGTQAEKLLDRNEHSSSPEKLRHLVHRIKQLTKKMFSAHTYARLLVKFIQHLNSFWGTTNSPIAGHALIILKCDRIPSSSNAMLTLNFLKPHGERLGKKIFGRSHKVIQYRESLLGSHFENRYHIRIQVPPSLRIVSVKRVAEEKNRRIVDNFNPPPNDWVLGGQDDRVEIHDRKIARSPSDAINYKKHYALIQVEPLPHVFYTKAVYTVLALLGFLLFTDWYSFKPIDIMPASVALAALFVGIPKLLGRATEDSLTESILGRMRQGLSGVVALSLAAGILRQLFDPIIQDRLSGIGSKSSSSHNFSIIGALFQDWSFFFALSPLSLEDFGILFWLSSCTICLLYLAWIAIAYCFYSWNSRKASKLFLRKTLEL